MTFSARPRGPALALAALLMAAAPAALAQPYPGGPNGPPPSDYDQQRRDYDAQYGPGAYDRYQADQQARADGQACHEQKKDNEVGGALLGGLAGAAAGSQIAKGQTNCGDR